MGRGKRKQPKDISDELPKEKTEKRDTPRAPACGHRLSRYDPHDRCEPCREKYNAPLCTPTRTCRKCKKLSEAKFEHIMKARKRRQYKRACAAKAGGPTASRQTRAQALVSPSTPASKNRKRVSESPLSTASVKVQKRDKPSAALGKPPTGKVEQDPLYSSSDESDSMSSSQSSDMSDGLLDLEHQGQKHRIIGSIHEELSVPQLIGLLQAKSPEERQRHGVAIQVLSFPLGPLDPFTLQPRAGFQPGVPPFQAGSGAAAATGIPANAFNMAFPQWSPPPLYQQAPLQPAHSNPESSGHQGQTLSSLPNPYNVGPSASTVAAQGFGQGLSPQRPSADQPQQVAPSYQANGSDQQFLAPLPKAPLATTAPPQNTFAPDMAQIAKENGAPDE